MGDWQTGNLGRLNASIQAMGEAGRIKESKKNRFASIAEGLTNNLFKRQSETAAQQHDKDMEQLMYGSGVAGAGAPGAAGQGGAPVGTRVASQMTLNQQSADLEAASRSRSYEEYLKTVKDMGLEPQLSQKDYLMGWAPSNYYDAYKENERNSGNMTMYIDAAFKGTNGPAQFLTKDMEGNNSLDWNKFVDPKTGMVDQKKVADAKAAMTSWLEGAIRDDKNLSRIFPAAQQKDTVRRYIDNIFNQAQGITETAAPANSKAEAIKRINAIKELINKSGATKDQINAANAQYKAEGRDKHFAMSINTEKPVVEMLNVMPDNDVIATMNDYEDYLNKLKTIMNPKARSGY